MHKMPGGGQDMVKFTMLYFYMYNILYLQDGDGYHRI